MELMERVTLLWVRLLKTPLNHGFVMPVNVVSPPAVNCVLIRMESSRRQMLAGWCHSSAGLIYLLYNVSASDYSKFWLSELHPFIRSLFCIFLAKSKWTVGQRSEQGGGKTIYWVPTFAFIPIIILILTLWWDEL